MTTELEARPVACDDCDWTGTEADLTWPPPDLHLRLDPGGTVPAGECPECGVLAYLVGAPYTSAKAADKPRVTYVCEECGGGNVCRDAAAGWCEDSQQWVLITAHDQATCEDCDSDCELTEKPLAAA